MNFTEIPKAVTELVQLSLDYLAQETLQPLRRLGQQAGLMLAGGICFALGGLFLAIAGLRVVLALLPQTTVWSAVGYLGTALLLGLAATLMLLSISRTTESS